MADLWKFCGGRHGCQERRWIEEFRILSSGCRAAYCRDCENRYDSVRKYHTPNEEPVGLHPETLPGAILVFPGAVAEPFFAELIAA